MGVTDCSRNEIDGGVCSHIRGQLKLHVGCNITHCVVQLVIGTFMCFIILLCRNYMVYVL